MSAAPKLIEVDARFLQPPEPFERTIEALDRLEPGGEVHLLIHREPHPLYQMLEQSGYRYKTETRDDGHYLIRIRIADD
ncbi:MAG: sulfurtransferase TusA family protein [Burkholderiaceae bacterium]|nr:sulfurtransferase TusA family protein [Burkholderiaceae bacterium]